jgi:hypothetical protein
MRTAHGLLSVLMLTPLAAAAAEELPEGASAYLGVTTNYVNRGVSVTSDHEFYHRTSTMTPDGGMGRMHATTATTDDEVFAPALYGGFDYLHTSGFYVGASATSVDIPGSDAALWVDASAGYRATFGGGWRWDAGVVFNAFPGEPGFNYGELYAALGYGPWSGQVWHDPANRDTYARATRTFDLGSGFDLDLYAGHYAFEDGPDYDDFGVRLSKAFGAWRAGVAVTDTSLDHAIPYAWVVYRFAL